MTHAELLIGAGALLLTLLGQAVIAGMAYGRLRTLIDEFKQQLTASGEQAFIRRAEFSALRGKVDEVRSETREEIGALRDVTTAHSQLLAEHETKIAALERAQG